MGASMGQGGGEGELQLARISPLIFECVRAWVYARVGTALFWLSTITATTAV